MNEQESGKDIERAPVQLPGEMPDAASRELEMLGLSSEFPVRMQEFNVSLANSVGNSSANFAGYKFILSPDPIRPAIETKQKYYFPFNVEVDVSPSRRAVLDISPNIEGAVLTSTRIDQLQALFGESNTPFSVTVFKPLSKEELFTKPLEELTDEELMKVHPTSAIIISTQSTTEGEWPVSVTIQASQQHERARDNAIIPTVKINGIRVEGSSSVIEASLDTISKLAETFYARD